MAFGTVFRNYFHSLRADGFIFRNHRRFGLSVINKTGSTIAADKLVCISGYDTTSKRPKAVLADADAAGLAGDIWYTPLAIKDGKVGNVFQGGLSGTFDTSSANAAGDPVYLSTTAGGVVFTNPPTGPSSRQVAVGFVHSKSSTGQIKWDIAENSNKIPASDISRSTGRVTAQTAASGTIVTFTPGADGTFEVCANVTVTTATTYSFLVTMTYTDENNAAATVNLPFRIAGATTAVQTTLANTDGTHTYLGVPMRFRAKSGTAITVQTNAGGTYTAVAYNAEAQIEQIA